jgi:hypothetical protein
MTRLRPQSAGKAESLFVANLKPFSTASVNADLLRSLRVEAFFDRGSCPSTNQYPRDVVRNGISDNFGG